MGVPRTPKVPSKLAEAAERTHDDVPRDPSCNDGPGCGVSENLMGSTQSGRRSASEARNLFNQSSPRVRLAEKLDQLEDTLRWQRSTRESLSRQLAAYELDIANLEGEIALARYKLANE